MEQHKQEMRNSIEQLTDKGHNVAVQVEYADMAREVISELNIEYKKKCRADRWGMGATKKGDSIVTVYKVN